MQAAHCVATAIEEGTTVPAGTQAETRVGRRSADKSGPPVLRSPEHIRECRSEAAPCVTALGSPVPRIFFHTRECTGEPAYLDFASVHVDTSLSDTSSRAHPSVVAPVVIGLMAEKAMLPIHRSFLILLSRIPVPIDKSSGQRSDGIFFELPTMSVAAPAISGASSGQRSVSDSQHRGEVGSIFVAPSSTEVYPGQRITRAHTDERSGHRASSARRERRSETASANDPGQRLNPSASQTAHLVARRGGRPTLMSSRSSGSTPGQSYRDSIRALAGHARSTAESIARLMAPTRQRPHPRS